MTDAPESSDEEPARLRSRSLVIVLAGQVFLGCLLLTWVALGSPVPGLSGKAVLAPAVVPLATIDRFDGPRAWKLVQRQIKVYGERPAGSAASRRLAEDLRRRLPNGTIEPVPGGLQNVVGTLPGKGAPIVIGAHYDSAPLPKFVGANDGAAGVAAVVELARVLKKTDRGKNAPPLRFVLFDGEELPPGGTDEHFERDALRGSKVEAARNPKPRAMILLDYIAERSGFSLPRERNSDKAMWRELRAAAKRAGTQSLFPASDSAAIIDDHVPFIRRGIPAIDLIDFDYPQTHTPQDDLAHVSERSLDAVGETVLEFLRTWPPATGKRTS